MVKAKTPKQSTNKLTNPAKIKTGLKRAGATTGMQTVEQTAAPVPPPTDESRPAKVRTKARMNGSATPAPNGAGNGIAKPSKFSLADFRTEQNPKATGIEPTCPALPMMRLADVKDFFVLHPHDSYWSNEVALIQVPTKGSTESTQHLILDGIVKKYSDQLQARVKYCQIVLGAKPDNVFFLGLIPTRNLDNTFNASAIRAAVQAKSGIWTTVTSRKSEGHDDYFIGKAQEGGAFLETKWPTFSLDEIVEVTVGDKFITTDEHSSLDRLLGRRGKLTV